MLPLVKHIFCIIFASEVAFHLTILKNFYMKPFSAGN